MEREVREYLRGIGATEGKRCWRLGEISIRYGTARGLHPMPRARYVEIKKAGLRPFVRLFPEAADTVKIIKQGIRRMEESNGK